MSKINMPIKWLSCAISCLVIFGAGVSEGALAILSSSDTGVYIHTDRSYYLPGESVFFKAYFLDGSNNRTYPLNDSLHILILDQYNTEVASGIFPVTNNLIDGSVELPEFLTEGSYILVAFTRSMNNIPEKMFSVIIEIRKSVDNPLITEISPTDSIYSSGDIMTALIRFSGKDNRPVPASFAYQLTGISGEIVNGNNKAGSDGDATLKIPLPKFDSKETLKLLIEPSYRGLKTIYGLVLPTRFNRLEKNTLPLPYISSMSLPHLNIQIRQINLTDENEDKIKFDISVTDEKGNPAMANLSVSVSDLIPHFMHNDLDNFADYLKLKSKISDTSSPDIRKYFTGELIATTQAPGHAFVVQEKNNPRKLRKKPAAIQKNQIGYSSDRSIFDILMQIRPYHIDNNKITFGLRAMNSVTNIDGALIVVDGIRRGTDASILNTIPVSDIAHIAVSTSTMDIQRYSAMNNVGVIEITLKKNKEFLAKEANEAMANSCTLFWRPDIMTDNTGNASITFPANNSNEILISVAGMAADGKCGSTSISYVVKH